MLLARQAYPFHHGNPSATPTFIITYSYILTSTILRNFCKSHKICKCIVEFSYCFYAFYFIPHHNLVHDRLFCQHYLHTYIYSLDNVNGSGSHSGKLCLTDTYYMYVHVPQLFLWNICKSVWKALIKPLKQIKKNKKKIVSAGILIKCHVLSLFSLRLFIQGVVNIWKFL